MKNTLISIVAFLALLFFVYFADNNLENICETIIETTDEIQMYLDGGDWDNAYLSSLSIVEKIEENKTLVAVYINHCEVDNVLLEANRLSNYIKSENLTESQVSNELVEVLSRNILLTNKLNISNIF